MNNKGLCITCTNDKNCSFPRKFPILQCEEFSNYIMKMPGTQKKRPGNKDRCA